MHFKKHEYVRSRKGYHCYEFVSVNTLHHYFMYRVVHDDWTMYVYVLEIFSEILTESLDNKYLTQRKELQKLLQLSVESSSSLRENHGRPY
jgi:hypothetical protein